MDKHLVLAEGLAHLMDTKFSFLGIRFGLDPLLDLIPGIGDVIGLCVSLYIVWIATKFELPQDKMVHIIGNIVLDFLIGLIPVIGGIGDIFFRANLWNIQIIKAHLKNSTIEGEIIT